MFRESNIQLAMHLENADYFLMFVIWHLISILHLWRFCCWMRLLKMIQFRPVEATNQLLVIKFDAISND